MAEASPQSYEDEVLKGELEWSEEHYDLADFVKEYENYLPQIVRVCEGIYGENEASSFSMGDVYKVHGIRRENKILASVRIGPGNNEQKITIPKSFQGTLAVIPTGRQTVRPDNEYKIDELLSDFTLPVKARFVNFDRSTDKMLQELGGEDTIFTLKEEVTDTYVIASTKVDNKRFMCIMTLDVEVEFEVADEDADYELIVNRFKLPDIEVGKMSSIPYLEYYERPTVYRPGEAEYLNAEAIAIATMDPQISGPTGQPLPKFQSPTDAKMPPIIDRRKKPPPDPPSSPANVGDPPPIPPRTRQTVQASSQYEIDDGDDDYEEIPDELYQARQMIIKKRDEDQNKNLPGENFGSKRQQSKNHAKDEYENFTPIKPQTKEKNFERMSVQEIATFLRHDIHVTEEAVSKFIENEVDGTMLKSLLEEGDYNSLVQELSLTKLQAKKIKMYIVDGWRPVKKI